MNLHELAYFLLFKQVGPDHNQGLVYTHKFIYARVVIHCPPKSVSILINSGDSMYRVMQAND